MKNENWQAGRLAGTEGGLTRYNFSVWVKVPSGIAEDLDPKFLNRQAAKKTRRMALSWQKR